MTMLDFLLKPELVQQAWDYFRNVQTKDVKYQLGIPYPPPPEASANGGGRR